jgi:hypothetical protein
MSLNPGSLYVRHNGADFQYWGLGSVQRQFRVERPEFVRVKQTYE